MLHRTNVVLLVFVLCAVCHALLVNGAKVSLGFTEDRGREYDSFLIEECECINGECIPDANGKQKCVCPPTFGHYTEHHCKECNCGEDFNCTYEGIFFVDKHCICPEHYKDEDGVCKGPCDAAPCKNNGTCSVIGNSFECKCVEPYSGNTCTEKCECINGKCTLDESGKNACVCPPAFGHFTEHHCKACECGDGFNCTYDGILFKKKHCICPPPLKVEDGVCKECECIDGECIKDENGNFQCVCPPEYAHFTKHHCKACNCGSGFNCTYEGFIFERKHCICPKPLKDEDGICKGPCDTSPCKNNGTCVVTGDSFNCICAQPYTGETCTEKCECINGKCIMDTNGKYECACPPDFGHFTKHHCKSCDCGTGFNCTFEGFIFEKKRCICPEPYKEKDGVCKGLDPCDPKPCENKGKCSSDGNSFKCDCIQPYSGTTCAEENTQGPTTNLALKIVMPILSVILIASFVFNYYRWRKQRTDVQTESDTQPCCSTKTDN